MTTIDGKQFECDKHGIDYRIVCGECGEKWAMFGKLTTQMIEDNNSDEIIDKDKL